MTRYNHAFTVAFSLESEHPLGEDVTGLMMKTALEQRIKDLDANKEWDEAVGSPFDSYKV